jgi:hypothetical protein
VYVDDINLYKKSGNPNLAKEGWLITPNPSTGPVTVQFNTPPANLKGICVFNSIGQKVAEKMIDASAPATLYQFNLGRYASGVYVIRLVYSDHTISKKLIKK